MKEEKQLCIVLVVDVDCQDFPTGKDRDMELEAGKGQDIVEDVRFREGNVGDTDSKEVVDFVERSGGEPFSLEILEGGGVV